MIRKFKEYSESAPTDQSSPYFPKNNGEILKICGEYHIKGFSINAEAEVDVHTFHNLADPGVMITNRELISLPIKFGQVQGYFSCLSNKLNTLEGCPYYIGGFFSCAFNRLTSLKYGPEFVGGAYFCHKNKLTSLEGSPYSIDGSFDCSDNNLITLKGAPQYITGGLDCTDNNLYSLEGAPKEVNVLHIFSIKRPNPVLEIMNIFPRLEALNVMQLWDDFNPVCEKDGKWYISERGLKELYKEITGEDFNRKDARVGVWDDSNVYDLPDFKNYTILHD